MSYRQQLECVDVKPAQVVDVAIVKEEDRKKLIPTLEDATFQDAGDAKANPPRPRQTIKILGAPIDTFVLGSKYDFVVTEVGAVEEPEPIAPGEQPVEMSPSEVAAGPGPEEGAAEGQPAAPAQE